MKVKAFLPADPGLSIFIPNLFRDPGGEGKRKREKRNGESRNNKPGAASPRKSAGRKTAKFQTKIIICNYWTFLIIKESKPETSVKGPACRFKRCGFHEIKNSEKKQNGKLK